MADIIRLLPESIASQIAAGEVVTAPSAVVKELLENSIDAGATSIQLEVMDGGKALIHVLDNGSGMSPADARMAFEKHATSKIRKAEDLYQLSTMGFRGEALAAISAVSQIELRTRRADSELGTEIHLSGSSVIMSQACVTPVGTSLRVKDLFFNIPARRRFLKSNTTEFKGILREFIHVALVNPSVAMSLYNDGALVKELLESGLKERILSIAGRSFHKKLLPINYTSPMVTISGFVLQPDTATVKGMQQYMFVNNRYMSHPYFRKAVELAFEGLIADNKRPSFFIYFTVPPDCIDVNISPTKTDIRFVDEQLIFTLLKQLVREVLSANVSVPVIDFNTSSTIEIPAYSGRQAAIPAEATSRPAYAHRVFMGGVDSAGSSMCTPSNRGIVVNSMNINWEKLGESFAEGAASDKGSQTDSPLFHDASANAPASMAHGVFCGTDYPTTGHLIYKGRYIVTSLRRSLTLIDYRRAKERILYERYILEICEGHIQVQELMFPETLALSLEEKELLELLIEDIHSLGFVITLTDDQTYTLTQAPTAVAQTASGLLRQMLNHCIETGEHERDFLMYSLAAAMAEAEAPPYGKTFDKAEADDLLAALFATTNPNITPRGQTIMVTFPEEEVARRFS